MIRSGRCLLSVLAMVCAPAAGWAQSAAPSPAPTEPPPAIRRWIDLQAAQVGLRYRWVRNSDSVVTADSVQWHGLARGRFLFDSKGQYSLSAMASAGTSFIASWNDTGIRRGDFVGRFRVRHLFLTAAPVTGLEFQLGGLAPNRGEVTENISYDTDGYLVGQRVTIRPTKGRITQLSGTIGHFGDLTQPGVIRRLDDSFDYNYGQVLVGLRLHPRVNASFDYTHEDSRDILREAVFVRSPATSTVLTGVRFESYQRVSGRTEVRPGVFTGVGRGWGFNASADLRVGKLQVTTGVMNVDRDYGAVNGDRYGSGKRYYSIGTLPVNGSVSLIWYHTHAFGNNRPIPNHHRVDVILMVNPTASLKRARIF